MFRADVLRLLPVQMDANGKPTGKRLVNDADLLSNWLPPHTVTLPDGDRESGSAERRRHALRGLSGSGAAVDEDRRCMTASASRRRARR